MFGDTLSDDNAKQLIKTLSTCAFPFQCECSVRHLLFILVGSGAHGRPSAVPLVDLKQIEMSSFHDISRTGPLNFTRLGKSLQAGNTFRVPQE